MTQPTHSHRVLSECTPAVPTVEQSYTGQNTHAVFFDCTVAAKLAIGEMKKKLISGLGFGLWPL
jgi:hypothetical protein